MSKDIKDSANELKDKTSEQAKQTMQDVKNGKTPFSLKAIGAVIGLVVLVFVLSTMFSSKPAPFDREWVVDLEATTLSAKPVGMERAYKAAKKLHDKSDVALDLRDGAIFFGEDASAEKDVEIVIKEGENGNTNVFRVKGDREEQILELEMLNDDQLKVVLTQLGRQVILKSKDSKVKSVAPLTGEWEANVFKSIANMPITELQKREMLKQVKAEQAKNGIKPMIDFATKQFQDASIEKMFFKEVAENKWDVFLLLKKGSGSEMGLTVQIEKLRDTEIMMDMYRGLKLSGEKVFLNKVKQEESK